MEVSGVVLRQPSLCFSSSRSKELEPFSADSVLMGHRRSVKVSDFCDKGHLKYYNSSSISVMVRCEKQENKGLKKVKKLKKQKLKLLKGLSRDLSTFSQIGFGLDSDHSLLDRVKGNIISDAAEVLLEQLQKLRAEEKELKRKKKEEKSRLKPSQNQNRFMSCEMSSSSSSESSSSDSECGEIVDMKSLKRPQSNQNTLQPVIQDSISPSVSLSQPHVKESMTIPVIANDPVSEKTIKVENECVNSLDNKICSKKIEVCMGGKCKKSGAALLLDEFQRAVGIEGAVSGCKCMGKCRDGPNVKVVEDNNVKSSSNPLCVGVGLEDVGLIVSNFLGDNHNQLEFAA
ncbi:hypothetical protein RD792_003362 [Penstemon davidsonii]|uniref:Diacylglycerol O-acyltransferase 3, cytosolic n=1 Tax=Penstemon davidsonii TaxID=160366 RepID=A0ABR0DUI2_9LAMI|nr:hypothetical protein RD792_003362 [Penstemon davidsonii]